MSTPGSKSTVHLAKTTPGEVDPTEGLDAGDVNDDQSITEPLPLPEGSAHQSGQRPLFRLAQADERGEPSDRAAAGASTRAPKTSLLEWLNLIEIGCRDATVTVQADDGRDGRLWCVRGEIIDAEWGPLKGAVAADRILSFRDGDISVAFGAVDRPRVISSTTGVLLLQTAQHTVGSGAKTLPLFGEGREFSARGESQPPAATPSGMGSGLHSEMPVARSNRPSAPVDRPVSRQTPYMAGALAGAAIAFTVWQLSGPAPKPKPTAAAAPVAQAPATVTIEPIADSRLRETPVNVGDGLLVAADEPVSAGGGERVSKPASDRQRHARSEAPRIRRAPTPARTSADEAQARKNEAQAKAKGQQQMAEAAKTRADIGDASKPKIQIIEPQMPRVQIIEPGKPKVQIIEPLKSKTDNADTHPVKLLE